MLTDPFRRIGNAPFNANQLVIYWLGSVHEARRLSHLSFNNAFGLLDALG